MSPSTIKLMKLFAIASAFMIFPACASLPNMNKDTCMDEEQTTVFFGLYRSGERSYNEGCAINNTAKQMMKSDDIGVKAVGHSVFEQNNNQVQDVSSKVRELLYKEATPLKCKVQSVSTSNNGKKLFKLGDCVPAP